MSKETGYCTCGTGKWKDTTEKQCAICGLPSYAVWVERKLDQYSMVGRKLDE